MILAVTGSCARPISQRQGLKFIDFLQKNRITVFHHGCAIHADAEAHWMVRHQWPDAVIHGHPSTLIHMTDERALADCDIVHPRKPPLERNRDIVAPCERLIALPRQSYEVLRSGTWATVRYALRSGKIVKVINP